MRLYASTCRKVARDSLKGRKWKTSIKGFIAALLGAFTNPVNGVLKLMLLSAILLECFEAVPHYRFFVLVILFLIALGWLYIGSFIRLGYLDFNLSILDRREKEGSLFGSTTLWWNSLLLRLTIMLRIAIGCIFLIIPGVLTYYSYAMAPFLLEERKNMSVEEAMKMSREKMKGHRWEFFCLRMSFLGWKLIGFLTMGIAFFWVNPYYSLAETVFFNEISGRAKALYGRS